MCILLLFLSLSFLFGFVMFFFALVGALLIDIPLIFFCPADHVPDWQPRVILLGMVEARLVNVGRLIHKLRCFSLLIFSRYYYYGRTASYQCNFTYLPRISMLTLDVIRYKVHGPSTPWRFNCSSVVVLVVLPYIKLLENNTTNTYNRILNNHPLLRLPIICTLTLIFRAIKR